MVQLPNRRILWPTMILVTALPRILGAFFLPNAFGDAYVYIRDIGTLSTKISSGAFRVTDLFGFWLPLYQFIAALLNVFVRNGFYSGKLVSALFGSGACLFVYGITLRLTGNRRAGLVIFLVIALNPLHIFYSASAMTDVPHSFFVLAALYFVLSGNWIVAAIFGALAGLTRVESWMLLAIIPLVQFIRERRVSPIAMLIILLPPLFWFYISWKATGDAFACFKQRQEYHDWLMIMNPAIAHFSIRNILRDAATLLVSTDIAVLVACFVAAWFLILRARRARHREGSETRAIASGYTETSLDFDLILAPFIFFFAFLGLLLLAYLTHQQPIIFPRYGLILFSLGLPVLAWTYLWIRGHEPNIARRVLIGIAVICVFDASVQLAGAVGEFNRYSAQRVVADYLRDHFDKNSNARIFCDEGTVRVLSGIPEEKFLSSANAPRDREAFLKFLDKNNVEYLVFIKRADSIPSRVFPDADSNEPKSFDLVIHSYTDFLPADVWLYRVRSVVR